uniref:Transposable element P transposase-like RNase H domain-containing protein n=1 Tax=Amphimedon queenslandica TaxID=400682 RepID=A0A1X7VGH2_AMPQE
MINSNDNVKKAYPEGSFLTLFWEEQLNAASVKDARLIRWHRVMVKWCLNLKLLFSSAYHALRRSGFIELPTERTLRDYVPYTSNKCGFQDTVHQQLLQEVDQAYIPSSRRYVSLILDEMNIKGLVYNKFTGEIVGFTHLGDVNDDLQRLEEGTDHPPSVATHTLALMVSGLLFKLEFPYAHIF